MLNYTLHNHTYLCKHAVGDSKMMIEQAIADGFKMIGISDHIAYPISATAYRMEFSERIGYLEDLKKLKATYEDKVIILRGFEAEYQPEFIDYYQELFKDNLIDYLVLGQHYHDVERPHTYFGRGMSLKRITDYVNRCISAFETGCFFFIAHPDLFLNEDIEFSDEVKEECLKLIKSAQKNNVYLELNAGGLRNGKKFPHKKFFELVAQLQAPVIINSDAHHPMHINDQYLAVAYDMALAMNLNLVEPDFITYQQRIKTILAKKK